MRYFSAIIALVVLLTVQTPNWAASPVGKWRGSWSSQTSGHKGPMRARVRQTGPDSYRAVFAGRFALVVPFVYSAKLQRVPGTCNCYRSEKRLPLMGTYTMTANVSSGRFYARYKSKKDVGVFDLSR